MTNLVPPHRSSRVPGTESSRRLLSVLLSFSESRPLWTVPELAEELGLTPSTVYRYIGVLRETGLVERAPENRYALSERVISMSHAVRAARGTLGDIAAPVLRRLRDTIDETVLVGRRIGWNVFTVAREDSRKPVRLQFEEGQAMQLHAGAVPRILLAAMPLGEQEQYLHTLSESERSREELTIEARKQTRKERVTESFDEVDEGIWGVAAAIVDRNDEVVGAIACAAPLYRTDIDKRRMIRELIIAGADEIAVALRQSGVL